jgi:hypothetical protein
MLGGELGIEEDRVHRADDLTLLALDAHFGINVVLWSPREGMNAGDRADVDARPIICTQRGDNVRHGNPFY